MNLNDTPEAQIPDDALPVETKADSLDTPDIVRIKESAAELAARVALNEEKNKGSTPTFEAIRRLAMKNYRSIIAGLIY